MELCKYPCQCKTRVFQIEAIELPIVYNRYGDYDPHGLLYVLQEDVERVKKGAMENFQKEIPQPFEGVRPLVIRANLGDEIKVYFKHSLNRNLSIHVQGLSYDVQTSDGAYVGRNMDSTTAKQIIYTWYATKEGIYLFHDMGDMRSGEEGTNVHGLFGAIIIEEAGATWLNPETGEELNSGLFADIYHPVRPAFREYAVFFQDELEIKDKNGNQPMDHHTGLPSNTTGISYRAEPMRNRHPLTEEHTDSGEDISMSSWVYQDPAPPILKAYVGDPAKIRLIHGGIKETHVFHLHNHQWRLEGENTNSIIIDSISISPQECYTLDILHGAGSLNGMIGDAIFHCHLYPHFHEGMWTLWRIYDRLQDGTGTLPDGTIIPALIPLKDRERPPKKDEMHPGYPNFINGTVGARPSQPPFGILGQNGNNVISPTTLEKANFIENFNRGALYTDTCPCHIRKCDECKKCKCESNECMKCKCENNQDETCKDESNQYEKCKDETCEDGNNQYEKCKDETCKDENKQYEKCKDEMSKDKNNKHIKDECKNWKENEEDRYKGPVKVFEIALVQAKVTYNSYGWHDPQGRFFVLKEQIEQYGDLASFIQKVEEEQIPVEPLVIRANAGDCIEIRFTNLVPEFLDGNAFQLETRTDIVGYHIHLVKFDTIVSDGTANGWNNIAGARNGETLVERFFADTELKTVFFHDHLFANSHQQHGAFGALIVEEAGATFHDTCHDTCTGKELLWGTKAVIKRRNGSFFREFALFVHDFALLFDKDGKPLNSPVAPGSHNDPGVMGINYRCEPMRERLKTEEDPAYLFSSYVHGDPATPILETYPGDELMIRLLDGAHEEQHSLNITGMSWKKEIGDFDSPFAASQTIGISEAFNLNIDKPYRSGDYLYYFGGIDDAWLGLWGIIRAYEKTQEHLKVFCQGKKQIRPLPPCPGKDAIIRKYEIAAIHTDIVYNKYGDHDPEGLMFVPLEEMELVLCGKYRPKPLILRENAGEWIEVTLHNQFGPETKISYSDYPRVPLDKKHEPSRRVSLNPQFLQYDVINDSGINVGYNNQEQTVGEGESKKYLWYADKEYGACILQSFGDMRNHRHHGLFGAIIIEPPNAKWYRNFSLQQGKYEEQVVITAPGVESFREFVVFIQNGIYLLDKQGNLIQTATQEEEVVDAEDTGEKGYNYRSERFANRLKKDSQISKIFSSKTHGEPSTPIFRAYTGDRVIFRTMMPADKPRNVGFAIHGHMWKEQPHDAKSRTIPMQGAISIGNRFDMELEKGASCYAGDYLYRSGSLRWDVESGMWGIFRVTKKKIQEKVRCKCQNVYKKVVQNISRK